ncbi:MAG: hypothetical protein ACYCSA_05065 [Thermoplasmataceae archaeon]
MNVAGEYTGKGFAISDVIDLLHIPRYTLYRNRKENKELPLRRGRNHSMFTMRKIGDAADWVNNEKVVGDIEKLFSQEFICYR